MARPLKGASTPLELVWTDLADPTRRAILDLLRQGPKTVGELTDHFPTSRFAIRKHLNVLESRISSWCVGRDASGGTI